MGLFRKDLFRALIAGFAIGAAWMGASIVGTSHAASPPAVHSDHSR